MTANDVPPLVAGLILAFGMAVFVARSISRPILEMKKAAGEIGQLSDEELVALLLATGTAGRDALQSAGELLDHVGSVAGIGRASLPGPETFCATYPPHVLGQLDGLLATAKAQAQGEERPSNTARTSAANRMVAIVRPDTGLLDEPTRPAMYAETDTNRNPAVIMMIVIGMLTVHWPTIAW